MFGKPLQATVDYRVRGREIKTLVHELNAFRPKEINDIWVERDLGGFLIKIESTRFRSTHPNVGLIKIHVTKEEFWARHGAYHTALKDKILQALKAL